ncbi:MAG: hypothetical protein M1281_19245 [Chloroflexi bacterium]|nr:hypothetical protein [Chloroflexota bacterium]
MNRTLPRILNFIVILSLSACSLGGAPRAKPSILASGEPDGQGATQPGAPSIDSAVNLFPLVTTADLQKVASGLPADPGEAALALAGMIYQGDETTAQAAVGEILRRAGVPLVSADGPVIGWPDDRVLVDAEVYVDFLPEIADSLRAGDFYTPTQLADLLAGIFQSEETLPARGLVSFFAGWGKIPDDPAELRWAGAAVRALAAQRGQVFYPQADLEQLHIDLLQTSLLLAQLTSRDGKRLQASKPGGPGLASLRDRLSPQEGKPCAVLAERLEKMGTPGAVYTEFLKERAFEDIKKAVGEKQEKNVDRFVNSYKITAKILSMYLLLAGATIKLVPDRQEVHFHHIGGGHAGAHVNLTATARFGSTLSGEEVKCWSLAGIDIPPGGPMKDFLVRWHVAQPIESFAADKGKYVTTLRKDSYKIYYSGNGGDRLGEDGISTLGLYTPTEEEDIPDTPDTQQEAYVWVDASLDMTDFPFDATDLVLGKVPGWKWDNSGDLKDTVDEMAAEKVLDLLISAIKRGGLPTATKRIKVTYHAPSIFVAKGEREIYAGWYDFRIAVDLYSCTGLAGPWQGSGGFQVVHGIATDIYQFGLKKVFGLDLPPPGQEMMEPQNFMIDPRGTNWVPLNTILQLFGKMRLTSYARNYYERYGKSIPHGQAGLLAKEVAGEIEVYLGGSSFADFEELGASPFMVYIEEADADPHCPSGKTTYGIE